MLAASRELKARFWSLITAGVGIREAAAAVGLHEETGRRWFRQAGGVTPTHVLKPPGRRYLSFAEREEIFAGVERGDSMHLIARTLCRAPSTVLRELRRNMWHQLYRSRSQLKGRPSGIHRRLPWNYRPSVAQLRADATARRPKRAKLATNLPLRELVEAKLNKRLSPKQIAVQLRRQFPNDREMWVSHEAIYQSIYVQGRGALRRELAASLRTGRALRHPHRKANERRGRIPGMVNISERPAEVEDRAVPGHWEGDLIIGRNNRSAIGTLVERSTRFLMLLHLPRGRSASEVEEAMLAATKRLPQALWKSLTWDQGHEMAKHADITIATGLDIYFCDPAKPWQRGSNENTNGLLRQYFPRDTDLRAHSADYLEFVSAEMNERPRMTLGWDSPAEALNRLLSEPSPSVGVASTE
jgi:transposase, IS30 family